MLIFESLGSMRRPSDRPTGMITTERPLENWPPMPRINAPSSGKSSVCVTTRSRASAPSSRRESALPPEAKMPPRKPRSNLPLDMRYAPSTAVPPPSGKLSTPPNSERRNARYGALKLGTPVACAATSAYHSAPTNNTDDVRDHRMVQLLEILCEGYPTNSAAFRTLVL